MFIMMLLPNLVVGVLFIIIFLALGYRLFCCWEDRKKDPDLYNLDPGPFIVSFYDVLSDYARSTRPDFRQDVHTYIFLEPPSVFTLTDFTFDFHIFGDFLWEWLTLFPKWAPFSQIAHLAMTAPPNNLNWSFRLITMIFYQKLSSNASVILKKSKLYCKKQKVIV